MIGTVAVIGTFDGFDSVGTVIGTVAVIGAVAGTAAAATTTAAGDLYSSSSEVCIRRRIRPRMRLRSLQDHDAEDSYGRIKLVDDVLFSIRIDR